MTSRGFLRGLFGWGCRCFGDSTGCMLLGHLPASFWLRSLVSKTDRFVGFCPDWILQDRRGPRMWLHVASPKRAVSVAEKQTSEKRTETFFLELGAKPPCSPEWVLRVSTECACGRGKRSPFAVWQQGGSLCPWKEAFAENQTTAKTFPSVSQSLFFWKHTCTSIAFGTVFVQASKNKFHPEHGVTYVEEVQVLCTRVPWGSQHAPSVTPRTGTFRIQYWVSSHWRAACISWLPAHQVVTLTLEKKKKIKIRY